MPEIAITHQIQGNVCLFRTRGYIDKDAGEQLLALVQGTLTPEANRVMLNFADSPVINSSGLSKIIGVLEFVLDRNDGRVAVCGLSQLSRTALRTTGVLQLILDCPSEADALAQLQGL